MGKILYLSTNQVIAINAVQIRLYSPGELLGVKDPNLLDSALNRPKQSAFGSDAYPGVHEKAAALFMGINEEQDFTVDVVNHKYSFEEIVSVIDSHTKKI